MRLNDEATLRGMMASKSALTEAVDLYRRTAQIHTMATAGKSATELVHEVWTGSYISEARDCLRHVRDQLDRVEAALTALEAADAEVADAA